MVIMSQDIQNPAYRLSGFFFCNESAAGIVSLSFGQIKTTKHTKNFVCFVVKNLYYLRHDS